MKPMKLYVASHSQQDGRTAASLCRAAGHEITSRWLEKPFLQTLEHAPAERTCIADEDYDDVCAADALVLLASPFRVSGGKFVEAGIALGQLKRVFVIGHRENMLLWHTRCLQYESVEQFLKEIACPPSPT